MLKMLFPVLFLAIGAGAGVAAGVFLMPAPGTLTNEAVEPEENLEDHDATGISEFVKLNNQFVVPVVQNERVASLVVMSLSLETSVSMSDRIFAREPKLRDSFLRVLFDHANVGGFDGAFTQSDTLDVLRSSLKDVARKELGDEILSVLITDIARQDN